MIRTMNIEDYDKIYDLWIHTAGMGLNTTDDSRRGNRKKLVNSALEALEAEGIRKVALVVFEKNVLGKYILGKGWLYCQGRSGI